MSTVKKIARNTSILFISRVIARIINLFYMICVARYLGVSNFGIITFALAFTAIFSVFADFGLEMLIVREVARNRDLAAKYIANLFVIKIILVFITIIFSIIIINLLGYSEQTIKVVYWIALSILFSTFSKLFYSFFQAFERMEYQSLGQIFNSILIFATALVAIIIKVNVIGFAFAYFLASISTCTFNFLLFKLKILKSFHFGMLEIDMSFWKAIIKEALPFGLGMLFVTIFYWVDSVMLSLMVGDEAVGLYNSAFRMVLVLLFIPHSFITAIYPVMSRFHNASSDSMRRSFEKSFKYLAITGIPIGIGTTLLAKRFILLIFGQEYVSAALSLQILVWSSVLIFMSIAYGNLLNCLNKQLVVTKITACCVTANIILNAILIPAYGIEGASISTVLTEFISLIIFAIYGSRIGYSVFVKENIINISKILAASLIMGIFVAYYSNILLPVLLLSAVILYYITLWFIKGIESEDINLLKKALL